MRLMSCVLLLNVESLFFGKFNVDEFHQYMFVVWSNYASRYRKRMALIDLFRIEHILSYYKHQ